MAIKNIYLVQRAEIKTPLASEDARLSSAVKMDYMGAAQFEFGALPKSFRRIEAKADDFKMRVLEEIKDGDKPLCVWSYLNDEDFKAYTEQLRKLREGKCNLHEWSAFEPDRKRKTDFWWDIQNDTMFGFHKPFMNRVGHYVASSLMYMNKEVKS